MATSPLDVVDQEYDRKGGAVALTRWFEKMETVIDNSGCLENQKVKYAASSLVNKALAWWKGQVQDQSIIGKLMLDLWNNKMVGGKHAPTLIGFRLARLCLISVTPESSRIKRYIADNEERLMIKDVVVGVLERDNKSLRSKGRTVADSIAERLTRPPAYKFKTDCSIIPVGKEMLFHQGLLRSRNTVSLPDIGSREKRTLGSDTLGIRGLACSRAENLSRRSLNEIFQITGGSIQL
ncbi:hypothetical protein Tco_0228227 [Tanacetum coccineum]